MRAEIHPAARRLTWLIIVIGAVAALIAAFYLVFNPGSGIALPFTRTALDVGWLLVFGAMWLVVGVVMLWWLRPTAGPGTEGSSAREFGDQVAPVQMAQDAHFEQIDARIKSLTSQIEDLNRSTARLDDLERTVEGISARLAGLEDLSSRLNGLERQVNSSHVTAQDQAAHALGGKEPHDLDAELGSLATAIQDAHARIDNLGDVATSLRDLESQLDALYVTLQDMHRRIDGLEQIDSR